MGEAPSPAPAPSPSPSPAPALWDWDYLDRCFARHRVCISFGLWICSSSCWIAAHALLLYLRCSKKPRRDQTAPCAACCLLTSLCDTVGAILARQLTIQVFTGAYLAAVDLVNFVFILFPVCGSRYKPNSGRGSRERKRKRRLRASLFALALPLSLGPGWALWAAVPKASGLVRGPQRRLLGSFLQDNTEILGYLLGGIAALGSWASRIPPLSRICRGRTFPSIHLWTRLLSALAGLLYASAIVAHDRRPEYLLRATPWFLTSLGRASLDLAIIFLSCVMKSKMRRALGFTSEARGSPDTQALLTCAEKEQENEEARNEARLGASHHTTALQVTQDDGSHQSLHGADHRASAAGLLSPSRLLAPPGELDFKVAAPPALPSEVSLLLVHSPSPVIPALSRQLLLVSPEQAAAPPGCPATVRRAPQTRPCRSPPRTLPFRSSGPACPPAAPPRCPPSTPTSSRSIGKP
nr:transmembrane protein 44 isoform X6 [Equus asinus]